jgi:hypothetical protein
MLKVTAAAAPASPFAHLARRNATAPPINRAEDKDDDDKKADDDDEEAKRKAEEDEKKKDDEAKKKAEEEDDDNKKKDDEARAARGDNDDGDVADERDPVLAAARARERGRVCAIMSSEFGIAHPKAAWRYAMGRRSRAQAIEDLAAMHEEMPQQAATSRADPLRERMAEQPKVDIGTGTEAGAQGTLAQQIVAAGKKRRGEAA